MVGLPERLQAVAGRVAAAALEAGRRPDDIRIVAVSKTFSPDRIREAFVAGQRDFGENYVQEALEKLDALADLPIIWHYIGPIQGNKTRTIAERFQWVHSVDRLKIAERLSAQRPPHLPPLDVCLQVNVSGEESKSGVAPVAVRPLAAAVAQLPGLRLRGLMAIPEPTDDVALQRSRFATLRHLRDATGLALDTLSMGMSDDLESAVAEGATIVRIGRAIFGDRG
ncbi:MAG: YggS family pyridoxal phosphate-dependent enzyme [Burkholderiales bacterium]|nr:YggS family pyridoxal phosphate-dependent enzyme [Burkholderiales bacterium]